MNLCILQLTGCELLPDLVFFCSAGYKGLVKQKRIRRMKGDFPLGHCWRLEMPGRKTRAFTSVHAELFAPSYVFV